jgi:hypothetical protein
MACNASEGPVEVEPVGSGFAVARRPFVETVCIVTIGSSVVIVREIDEPTSLLAASASSIHTSDWAALDGGSRCRTFDA